GRLDQEAALSVIIIYALVCVGTFFFFRRQGRGHFKLVRHAVMPFGATFIIFGIFVAASLPASATGPATLATVLLSLPPFIVGGWVLIGIGVIIAMGKKLSQPVTM
nr:hypothetical protein [Ktedonobacterales bacterium]